MGTVSTVNFLQRCISLGCLGVYLVARHAIRCDHPITSTYIERISAIKIITSKVIHPGVEIHTLE
jgi:hypothetical protein